jgi:ubiquinone/menaquinone biosynthesis C-methylase UbiE
VPRMSAIIAVAGVAVAWLAVALTGQQPTHGRLFPPEDLGILESPDRDVWQQPDRIMDALSIAENSRVADVGAGGGWFTIRLARRVGPNGRVYAQDIQPQMIESTKRRVATQGLENVEFVLATTHNPRLPRGLDAILVVDTYPQFENGVAILEQLASSLSPGGRLGIVDFKKDGVGGPGPPIGERADEAAVKRDADRAGLKLLAEETFLRYQFLLVFGRR